MCIHKKKYKMGVALMSNPPKYLWTCEKCGQQGYDRGKEDLEFMQMKEEFNLNRSSNFKLENQTAR